MSIRLYLVVPCFNEQDALPESSHRILNELQGMIASGIVSDDSRILFVDDGSTDRTWTLIEQLHASDPRFVGIKLAHNEGHQRALFAGLMEARDAQAVSVSLDADLQDDVGVLSRFVDAYTREGCEIVYGVRDDRASDSWAKRTTAHLFYWLMKKMGSEIIFDHADYRLMGLESLEALSRHGEVNLFLRGIVPSLGFKTGVVSYSRHERHAGTSKYPFRKMVSFAIDGITAFSDAPLRLIAKLGLLIAALSILGLVYALISKLSGTAVPGWTAIVGSMWLLGGIQLLVLGVVGIYIGKVYAEVKGRPRYTIERRL